MREAFARRGDPWTSWAAADSLRGLREKQRAVLGVLLASFPDGAPLESITWAYDLQAGQPGGPPPQSPSGIRTRVSELQARGYVVDTGRTVRTAAGRHARVLQGSLDPMVVGPDGQMRLA